MPPGLFAMHTLKQSIVGLLLGVLLVAAVEGGLRFVDYTYTREEVGFRFVGEELVVGSSVLVRDRRLFWRLRPDAPVIEDRREGARINTAGFRGALVPVGRRPGVARVACLGDSVTYGSGTAFAQTYVARLAHRLGEQGRSVEVLNGGCPGYSSFQGLELLKTEIVSRQPDVVTLLFGAWNDYTPAIGGTDAEKARLVSSPNWIIAVRREAGRFRLFMTAQWVVDWMRGHRPDPEFGRRDREAYIQGFRDGAPPEGRRVSPEEFRANLIAMVRLCRANHIRPILIDPPLSLGAQKDFPVYRTYRQIVAAVAADEDAPLLPAADALTRLEAKGETVFGDWVHPSAIGHAVIADLLTPAVNRLLPSHGDLDAAGCRADVLMNDGRPLVRYVNSQHYPAYRRTFETSLRIPVGPPALAAHHAAGRTAAAQPLTRFVSTHAYAIVCTSAWGCSEHDCQAPDEEAVGLAETPDGVLSDPLFVHTAEQALEFPSARGVRSDNS